MENCQNVVSTYRSLFQKERKQLKKALWLNIVLMVTGYYFKTKDETTVNWCGYVNAIAPFLHSYNFICSGPVNTKMFSFENDVSPYVLNFLPHANENKHDFFFSENDSLQVGEPFRKPRFLRLESILETKVMLIKRQRGKWWELGAGSE